MWVCGKWLVNYLVDLGVSKSKIFVLYDKKEYDFGLFRVRPISTYHDVDNYSYIVNFKPITMYYATDTCKLDYLDCLKGLDYYFIESNYSIEEIEKRVEEKQLNGEYIYEKRVINSHLSKEDCNDFLMKMMNDNSEYIYLHQHIEKESEKNV